MTALTTTASQLHVRLLALFTALTGLVSVVAVVVLVLTGHDTAAAVVGAIGGGAGTTDTLRVSVHIRR
ncbi:hypothetical protein AMK14_24500 [Streptomyces sp. TSRI0445]|uniref:hypothetical protein n=1 Tax=Streptomyces TaxID=1883 RepID=UPI00093C4453|nr:hypothetical protein [Streptomyces sp. TSRI0445]OKI66165.1 hypothetical protein AMK14_24500 [Streptomyces sp. TSRI0445]